MQKYIKLITYLVSIIVFFLLALSYKEVLAQVTSSGFAISIPIEDQDVGDGDIVCSYDEGFSRCNNEYDPSMYGTITESASVSVEDTELENSRLALTSGIATVNVTGANGAIEEGDFITSSEVPGAGKKATRNGYVLGTAMEGFDSANPEEIGQIQVTLNIHPAAGLTGPGSNLLQFIRRGLAVPLFEPLESLRYLLAILMVLISFTLGMIYFGRSSRAGIEAIGRNPLAKRVIQFTVLLNIVLTIVIVLVGLGIAYLILVL